MYTPYKMKGTKFYGKQLTKVMTKKLIGDQHKLPTELKAKIEAAPEETPTTKKGLSANIHAKRKRGEAPAKPGDKNYPTDKALRDSQ